LVGLKPSRDQIVWRHAGTGSSEVEFVVARSLRDTATFVDVLRRSERRAANGEFSAALRCGPEQLGTLRVGLCTRAPSGARIDRTYRELVERVGARLGDLGHRVEHAFPSSLEEYEERALYGAVLGPIEYRRCLEDLSGRLGRPLEPNDVEPFLWTLADASHSVTSAELDRASDWLRAWSARTVAWFEQYDLLITPTVPGPPPLLKELDPHRLAPLELLERMVPHMVFTEPWNATGQPAISLPLGITARGLPIGVQVVAAPGRDARLLSVAAWLLELFPEGRQRRPAIHA